jgi:hypothetical protein
MQMNAMQSVNAQDVAGLLRQLYDIVRKLEHVTGRKFTPDGHLVASVGEVWAREFFSLELYESQSNPEHDAKAPNGDLVQIKTTQGRSISICSEPQKLIVFSLKPDGSCETIFNGPGKLIWPHVGKLQKNGQCKISLTKLKQLHETVPESQRVPMALRRYGSVPSMDELPEWKDPIVGEIRRFRDEHAARFNHDLDAMARDLQEQEKKAPPGKLVNFKPRKVAKK